MEYLPPIQIIDKFNVSNYNYQNSYITYYTASLLFSSKSTANTFNNGFICGNFILDKSGDMTSTGAINISNGLTLLSITNTPTVSQNNLYSLVNVSSDIQNQLNNKIDSFNAVLTGIPTTTEPLITDNSKQIATTNYVNKKINNTNNNNLLYAPLDSPNFTGIPLCPTPAQDQTNLNQITNKTFVQTAIANLMSTSSALLDTLNAINAALNNNTSITATLLNEIALKANIDNAIFTNSTTINGYFVSNNGSMMDNMNIGNNLAIGNNINISGDINNNGNSKINNIKSKTIEVESLYILNELKYKNQIGVFINITNITIPFIKSIYDTSNLYSSNTSIRSQLNNKTLTILPNYSIRFFSSNILIQTINNNTNDIIWTTIIFNNNIDYCTKILIYYKNILL